MKALSALFTGLSFLAQAQAGEPQVKTEQAPAKPNAPDVKSSKVETRDYEYHAKEGENIIDVKTMKSIMAGVGEGITDKTHEQITEQLKGKIPDEFLKELDEALVELFKEDKDQKISAEEREAMAEGIAGIIGSKLYKDKYTQDINDTIARETAAGKQVIVDFHAEWCGPCHMLAPELDAAAKKSGKDVLVLRVDVDKYASDITKSGSIPEVHIFSPNGRSTDFVGVLTRDEILKKLEENAALPKLEPVKGQGMFALPIILEPNPPQR